MKKSKKSNRLNVFAPMYYPWKCLSNWKANIKIFFQQFKNAKQRATLGFCDEDTWDLDRYLLTLLPSLLERFKQLNNGYPNNCSSIEEWEQIIDLIIEKFKQANQIEEEIQNLSVDTPPKQFKEKIQKQEKLIKEGLTLLAKHLSELWW